MTMHDLFYRVDLDLDISYTLYQKFIYYPKLPRPSYA